LDRDSEIINDQIQGQAELFVPEIKESEQEVRVKILNKVSDFALEIMEINKAHEERKSAWRNFFILFLCSLLLLSITTAVILIVTEKISDYQLGVLVGIVIAELLSILVLMIKYVNNDLYLKTFKTVTEGLLDYLMQEKSKKDNDGDKKD